MYLEPLALLILAEPMRSSMDTMYPFLVRIEYRSQIACNGALVSPSWVLAAAKCFVNTTREQLTAHAGTKHGRDPKESTRGVARIVPHDLYEYPGWEHDIAVANLDLPFVMSSAISCVRTVARARWTPNRIELCHMVGWGPTYLPKKLLYIDKNVIVKDMKSCYPNSSRIIQESMICTVALRNYEIPFTLECGPDGMLYCREGTLVGVVTQKISNRPPTTDMCPSSEIAYYTFVSQYTGYYRTWLEKHVEDLQPAFSLPDYYKSAENICRLSGWLLAYCFIALKGTYDILTVFKTVLYS